MRLAELAALLHLSKNAVIEKALLEMNERTTRAVLVRTAFDAVRARDGSSSRPREAAQSIGVTRTSPHREDTWGAGPGGQRIATIAKEFCVDPRCQLSSNVFDCPWRDSKPSLSILLSDTKRQNPRNHAVF